MKVAILGFVLSSVIMVSTLPHDGTNLLQCAEDLHAQNTIDCRAELLVSYTLAS